MAGTGPLVIVMMNDAGALDPAPLVAVTEMELAPVADGVPEIRPVLSIERPEGSPVADHAVGLLDAVSWIETGSAA
jgi:hypothetical protein